MLKEPRTDSTNLPLRRPEVDYGGLLVDASDCTIIGCDPFDASVRGRSLHQPEVNCDESRGLTYADNGYVR